MDINNNEEPRNVTRKPRISGKLILGILLAALLVFVILSSFFVVDQTEQAVVTRFGKYNRTVGPGLQTKIPFGIEQSYNVPTQVVQTMTFGYRPSSVQSPLIQAADYPSESIMLTGDLNIIDVEWIVQYQIQDPARWLFSIQDKEATIRDVVQSVMNQLVGDLPILSVMTNERTRIEVEAQQMIQEIFNNYGLGVKVLTVKLQNIVPPVGAVQDAFEDVNKAIQDMNKYINEGKENYNSIIPATQGEAKKIVQVAQGYAKERVNTAKGDVARFNSMLDIYKLSPEITSERLYIETMENILAGDKVTIIDRNLDNFLPFKDVDKKTGGAK